MTDNALTAIVTLMNKSSGCQELPGIAGEISSKLEQYHMLVAMQQLLWLMKLQRLHR